MAYLYCDHAIPAETGLGFISTHISEQNNSPINVSLLYRKTTTSFIFELLLTGCVGMDSIQISHRYFIPIQGLSFNL